MTKGLFILMGVCIFASSAQATLFCTLTTVSGPNNYRNSGFRKTQAIEIKIEPSEGGDSAYGMAVIEDIKGSVTKIDEARVTVSILKYETSYRLNIAGVTIPRKTNIEGETAPEDSLFLLELPDNDRAWIRCRDN